MKSKLTLFTLLMYGTGHIMNNYAAQVIKKVFVIFNQT